MSASCDTMRIRRLVKACLMRGGPANNTVQLRVALSLLAVFLQVVSGRRLPDRRSQDVKIAVAEIPGKYTVGSVDEMWGFGALGSAVSIEDDLWQPRWPDIDKWWINQLNISPLRVWDHQSADIIFVPATLRWALQDFKPPCDSIASSIDIQLCIAYTSSFVAFGQMVADLLQDNRCGARE